MAWIIDKDYIAQGDDPSRVGYGEGTLEGETFRFRLRDEDGEVHYGGKCDRAAVEQDDEPGGLTNAWTFGMRDTGATDCELHRADAIALGVMHEQYADKYTRNGWTTIYA